MRLLILATLLMVACTESPRENIVDPVNRTAVELNSVTLDGGTILVEWRYVAEGDGIQSFQITREANGVTTNVATIGPPSAIAPDWETVVYRDSTLVGGVRVIYRVIALSSQGGSTTSNPMSIRVDGTRIAGVVPDIDAVGIQLSWEEPPAGALGFEVLRERDDTGPETIWTTEDVSLRSFLDQDVAGNTVYTYTLATLLDGGARIQSAPSRASIFGLDQDDLMDSWFWADDHGTPVAPIPNAREYLAAGVAALGFLEVWLFATDQTVFGIQVTSGGGAVGEHSHYLLRDQPHLPGSLSVSGGMSAHQSFQPVWQIYLSGISADGESAFLRVYDPGWEIVETFSWPSEGAQRTGLSTIGDDRLLFCVGNRLRLLSDDSLKVVDEVTIADGDPIDIDYSDGAIWLAYPDRLLKSNPASGLSDVTSWETIALPAVSVHAITSFRDDKIALLDGVNGKIHLLDSSGRVQLSWDAAGINHLNGDLAWAAQVSGTGTGITPIQFGNQPGDVLWQSDGGGRHFHFRPEGWLP